MFLRWFGRVRVFFWWFRMRRFMVTWCAGRTFLGVFGNRDGGREGTGEKKDVSEPLHDGSAITGMDTNQ